MTTQTEALKMALEALENSGTDMDDAAQYQFEIKAITAIQEALMSMSLRDGLQDGAQQSPQRSEDTKERSDWNEQVEPVAKVDSRFDSQVVWYLDQLPKDGTKLYTHPPVPYGVEPRTAQPKPLTDEKIRLIAHNIDTGDWNDLNLKECWHDGFKAGFREAEIEHNIKG